MTSIAVYVRTISYPSCAKYGTLSLGEIAFNGSANRDFQSMQEHEIHHQNDLHFVETLAEAVVQAHWATAVRLLPELELVEVLVAAGGSYCLLLVNAKTAIPPRIKIIAIKPNEGLLLGAVFSGSRGFSFLDDLLIYSSGSHRRSYIRPI